MVLSTEWSQVEVIDLYNDGNGLGFILVGGRSTGVVIKALTPGGVAERDGRLQCGDHVLQIGDVNLRGFSSEQVATVLRQTGAQVRLIVARPVESTATDFQHLASHAPIIPTKLLSDPEELSRHLFHNPGLPTSSEAALAAASLVAGGGAVGGAAMMLEGVTATETLGASAYYPATPDTELADLPLPPIPKELTNSSAARMCPKDLDIIPFSIVSPPPMSGAAGKTLSSLSPPDVGPIPPPPTIHSQSSLKTKSTPPPLHMDHIETVIAGITTTGTSSNDPDECCSITSSNYMDSPETETYHVKLCKNVYGLGITVAGYVCEEEDLSGIFVKSIIEGSAAEMSGQIQINDRIVAVDGKTLAGCTNHQAVEMLRNTDIEVHLTLERFLRGRKYEHLQVALTELKASMDTQSQYSLPPSPSIATLSWLPPKSDVDSIATEVGVVGGTSALDYGELPSRETVDSQLSHMLDKSEHSFAGTMAAADNLSRSSRTPTTPDNNKQPLANGKACVITSPDHANQTKTKQLNGSLGSRTPTIENVAEIVATPTPTPSSKDNKQKTKQTPPSDLPIRKLSSPITVPQHAPSQSPVPLEHSSPSADSLKVSWKSEFPDCEIIVAEINKLSGLGISLEGTVDVECGIEKRPHHYIRSILEDGPVGRQGILKPGDELLQVNEYRLQGLKHTEVVKILKELPSHVKLVCARGPTAPSIINTSQNPEAFETRSLLPGGHQSLQNLMSKAQSESSLYTSSTATLTDQQRSKSLENVSGLALWSSDVTIVEIEKTEQGFGFSILDYQDPLDPDGSVIVIRGLIRGGSAEATNDIFPGDRLVSVGEHNLQGLDLDEAVAILKGMPLGLTKLGICRPLSTSDSNIASPIGEGDSPST
ncbi:patj homolog isoform X1 [Musca domestica]|uniref:Patj homolog isoform X1 n=1 Tax=Musca domestica TaxID=7370 RepID=A0ABM3UYF3_MUSDO|nr:patj homolog isoform X1 [Musca domestica]